MSKSISDAFASMVSRSRSIETGEHLFRRGDAVSHMHLVLNGRINLIRHSEGGRAIVLQRSGPGDLIAEASLFSNLYHCDAIVEAAGAVVFVPKQMIHERLHRDPEFAETWMSHLGQEIQTMRFRNEVLSLPTVAARLDAWLAWDDQLPEKGEWKNLAHQIGVSPEALYRELAIRRVPRLTRRHPEQA